MCRRVVFLLISGCISFTFADSETQTDWFCGSREWYSVFNWTKLFMDEMNIQWQSRHGSIVLQYPVENIIDNEFINATSVCTKDIDSDGDIDIVGTSYHYGITYWENADGYGTSWIEHVIDDDHEYVRCVIAEDLDGDGDLDIAAAFGSSIHWWKNIYGNGTVWDEYVIERNFPWASSICAEDIDGDGDMDIVGSSRNSYSWADIAWWENSDRWDFWWFRHDITKEFKGAQCVSCDDIDDDGDIDIVGAAEYDDQIAWWENIDGAGDLWNEHIVGEFIEAFCVSSADMDSDGDIDILAGSNQGNICLWENMNGSGSLWNEHEILLEYGGIRYICAEDIDADEDMDILTSGFTSSGSAITWWENTDRPGESWCEHTIETTFHTANCIKFDDVNGDGQKDFVCAVDFGIAWLDLTRYYPEGMLESSMLDTQGYPVWGTIDWNADTPPGTSISFQVRSFYYKSPRGNWSDTLTSPHSLEGILEDGDRYVQYRAILNTSDLHSTPTLYDVTITWDSLDVKDNAEIIESGYSYTVRVPLDPQILEVYNSRPTSQKKQIYTRQHYLIVLTLDTH